MLYEIISKNASHLDVLICGNPVCRKSKWPSTASQVQTSASQILTTASQIPTTASQIPTSASQIPRMCGRFGCILEPGDLVRACTLRGWKAGSHIGKAGGKDRIKNVTDVDVGGSLKEDMNFGDEDDSFLREAAIPAVDQFTPQNHTAFLYTAPKLEESPGLEEEDESFLLEASLLAEEVEWDVTKDNQSAVDVKEQEDEATLQPTWRDAPCGGRYTPSTNLPPTSFTPVLLWDEKQGLLLQPMLWGLVPPWHPGPSPTSHGLTTNNARLEGVRASKLYGPSLSKRSAPAPAFPCVVQVCRGLRWFLRVVEGGGRQAALLHLQVASAISGSLFMMCAGDLKKAGLGWRSCQTVSAGLGGILK